MLSDSLSAASDRYNIEFAQLVEQGSLPIQDDIWVLTRFLLRGQLICERR